MIQFLRFVEAVILQLARQFNQVLARQAISALFAHFSDRILLESVKNPDNLRAAGLHDPQRPQGLRDWYRSDFLAVLGKELHTANYPPE